MPTGRAVCKEWAAPEDVSPLPSGPFLTAYMVVLAVSGLLLVIATRVLGPGDLRRILLELGVAIKKVANTAKEIERKVFHLCGLLVPLIYQLLLHCRFTQGLCVRIVWSITILGVSADVLRVHVPVVKRNWPLKGILREKEQDQLCGGTYFAMGCALSIHLFAPVIAMTSIIFLVLGDLSAALIGRSFGRSIVSFGVGPGGKKSLEGALAMFTVCNVFGCTIFGQVHLREYAVFMASLVATLTELYEPLGINDNVSIPVLSSLALTLGFARTFSCAPTESPLLWYAMES